MISYQLVGLIFRCTNFLRASNIVLSTFAHYDCYKCNFSKFWLYSSIFFSFCCKNEFSEVLQLPVVLRDLLDFHLCQSSLILFLSSPFFWLSSIFYYWRYFIYFDGFWNWIFSIRSGVLDMIFLVEYIFSSEKLKILVQVTSKSWYKNGSYWRSKLSETKKGKSEGWLCKTSLNRQFHVAIGFFAET